MSVNTPSHPGGGTGQSCPICTSATHLMYDGMYDDRYGYPGAFELLACASCGHRHIDAIFTPEQLGVLYSEYYPRSSMSVDDYAPYPEVGGFSSWFKGERCSAYHWVPKNVRILDIGCGFCGTLGYHKNRGCEVYGVEVDTNAKRVADKFGFNVKIGVFSADDYPADFFDYVTMDQVIEHVVNPHEVFAGIHRVLKPGGTAVFSTPYSRSMPSLLLGRRWLNWHTPYHLQHFSHASFRSACEKAGLELVKMRNITNTEWMRYQWLHWLRFPALGETSAFWVPREEQGPSFGGLRLRSFGLLYRYKVYHVLTRLFDWLGRGDNMLYFVRKPAHA